MWSSKRFSKFRMRLSFNYNGAKIFRFFLKWIFSKNEVENRYWAFRTSFKNIWVESRVNLFLARGVREGSDQPAHLHNLISSSLRVVTNLRPSKEHKWITLSYWTHNLVEELWDWFSRDAGHILPLQMQKSFWLFSVRRYLPSKSGEQSSVIFLGTSLFSP